MKLEKVRGAFGATVCAQRELKNLTQSDLASMIGCSQVTVAKIETGKQSVSLEQALVLSKLLGFCLDRIPIKIKMVAE